MNKRMYLCAVLSWLWYGIVQNIEKLLNSLWPRLFEGTLNTVKLPYYMVIFLKKKRLHSLPMGERYNQVQYHMILHRNDWSRTCIGDNTHKKHPKSIPNRRVMGCQLRGLGRKSIMLSWHYTVCGVSCGYSAWVESYTCHFHVICNIFLHKIRRTVCFCILFIHQQWTGTDCSNPPQRSKSMLI